MTAAARCLAVLQMQPVKQYVLFGWYKPVYDKHVVDWQIAESNARVPPSAAYNSLRASKIEPWFSDELLCLDVVHTLVGVTS